MTLNLAGDSAEVLRDPLLRAKYSHIAQQIHGIPPEVVRDDSNSRMHGCVRTVVRLCIAHAHIALFCTHLHRF